MNFFTQVIESSGFGADKFTMVRNNDGTGSLKVVQPLDYEDQLQRQGFRFRIQVRLHWHRYSTGINPNNPGCFGSLMN